MTLNSNEIQKILPHRWPFLMIDKVTACEPGQYADAIRCVSANELQFCGHFPLEALAQTGAVALLTEPDQKGKLVFFGGVKNARFRKQVVPGDVLSLHCEIIARRGPIGFGKAVATVDGKTAVTAELSFAISDPV